MPCPLPTDALSFPPPPSPPLPRGSPAVSAAAGEAKKPVKFRLGMVTYNVAAAWDVPTILKVCKATGISPVELRTTHKHGVEPSLSKEKRAEVRKQLRRRGRRDLGLRHHL